MPVHLNGATGYLWLSFGITYPLTLHWAALPLKLCMDTPTSLWPGHQFSGGRSLFADMDAES